MPHIRHRNEFTSRKKINHTESAIHIPIVSRVHNYLHEKYLWYKYWHQHPLRPHVHMSVFLLFLFFFSSFLITNFLLPGTAFAANIVWDGGGNTITCGSGNENNWSCAANWSGDVVPGAGDRVFFNGTSVKNALIDSGFGGEVFGLNINSGYTGIVSQATGVTLVIGGNGFGQADGTYSPSGKTTLDVNGSFVLSGGSFNAPPALRVSGNFNSSAGGTYTAGSGVVFDGTGTNSLNVNGSITFNGLTIDKSGGTIQIAAGDTINVTQTLNLNNGDLSGSGADAEINATAGVTFDPTFAGGNALLNITGATVRTVTLPAGVTVPKLEISNSNITLETSGSGEVVFDDTFDLTQGIFNQGDVTTTYEGAVHVENGTLNLGTQPAQFSDDFTLSFGTVNSGGSTFTMNTGTIFTIDGGDANFIGNTLTSMTVQDFVQTNGGFTAPTTTLYINSDFSRSGGGFAHSSGTVQFNGSSNTVSGNTTFYDFYKESVFNELSTIFFEAGSTTTVANEMYMKGFSLGQRLSVQSTITSTEAFISFATDTFSFLEVMDMNNVSSTNLAECFLGCVDGTGNTNWDFNAPPTITDIYFTSSLSATTTDASVILTEANTTPYYLLGSYSDVTGCGTISTTTGKFYFSPSHTTETCTASSTNPYDCYVETTCSLLNCDSPAAGGDFRCDFDLDYFTQPSNPSSSEFWFFEMNLEDSGGKFGTATGTIQVETLLAIQVSSSIAYGSLALSTTSSESALHIRNTGNVNVDLIISGEDLVCQSDTAIPAEQQRFTATSGIDYSAKISLSSTPSTSSIQVLAQTSSQFLATSTVYWQLLLPPSGVRSGDCSGTTTINGVVSQE